MSYTLRIAHLYPDHMNIYGDRGNILTLRQRCAWRGIAAELLPIGPGADVDWDEVDIAFFGGGQDSGQALIAEDFVQRHGPNLRRAIENGLVLLAICGGYQLLGHYFLTHTGERLPGVGALDVHTVGGHVRLIGNIVVEVGAMSTDGRSDAASRRSIAASGRSIAASGRSIAASLLQPATRLVGFENHSGRTYLGAGVRPLGRVLAGNGNNGEDGSEGAVFHNAIGCYMHGSLLPKNPQLADLLISRALQRRYGAIAPLAPLDDTLELAAQRVMVERVVSSAGG